MTDVQKLLAEYARTGSEAAFQELVTRYINFVYSTALRLVGGDTHTAEDVTQMVFAGLASKAGRLSTDVALGGWLHRYTYHVATREVRTERRRQAREQEAMAMNDLQNENKVVQQMVTPILDEAITRLGHRDRTAILLRFFEQRDFRSVGEVLGINEDAARMRVSRALEKLHKTMRRRGVTLTVAALGAFLAAGAVGCTSQACRCRLPSGFKQRRRGPGRPVDGCKNYDATNKTETRSGRPCHCWRRHNHCCPASFRIRIAHGKRIFPKADR